MCFIAQLNTSYVDESCQIEKASPNCNHRMYVFSSYEVYVEKSVLQIPFYAFSCMLFIKIDATAV